MRIAASFCVVVAVFLSNAPAFAQTPAVIAGPASCAAPEYRQFDFWLGDWNVKDASGSEAGTNRITSIQGGCVLLENWTGAKGSNGTSFNMYFSGDRKWHQTWVDNQGGRLDLAGGVVDGKMVLEGESPSQREPGTLVRQRISWEKKGADVRQLWEASRDGGKTWKVLFDGLYVRAKAK
ncbi:MAG: hypothetical protein ABI584_14690 [Acidobacteriota bacterium]